MRWRLLDDEEDEIRRLMDEEKAAGEGGQREEEDLRIALGKVVAKRSMPPGLRGLADDAKAPAVLPDYGDSQRTVPVELAEHAK